MQNKKNIQNQGKTPIIWIIILILVFVALIILVVTNKNDDIIPVIQKEPEQVSENTDIYGRFISEDCKVVDTCNGFIGCVEAGAEVDSSNCVAFPEDVCYTISNISCEKQTNDKCGWTKTTALNSCIETVLELPDK